MYSKTLEEVASGKSCLVIADGAAFGSELIPMLQLIREKQYDVTLWLPESFEWLLLKSGIVWRYGVDEILKHPEDYIESSEFASWERFFTWSVEGIMKDTNHPYSKAKLHEWYTSPENLEKFKSAIPKALRDNICGIQ